MQTQIIQDIINQFSLIPNATKIQMTVLATRILKHDNTSPKFKICYHYRGSIKLLIFLEKSTGPVITFTTHKCARLYEEQRVPHGAAVKNLVKYLVVIKNYGLILDPKMNSSLEVCVDSNFSKNCN